MLKYLLGFLALFAAAASSGLGVVPESLLEEDTLNPELDRQTRQQQIVQELILENNFGGGPVFGGPAFGGPGIGGPGFGGPGFGGPGFGGRGFGRPGFGGNPGFGGPGFGGPGFGGPGFGRAGFSEFARSYGQDEEPAVEYGAPSGIPAAPCPRNYLFSCGAVITPVPCSSSSCGGY